MKIVVENLTFSFPENWEVIKFDDTAFYRRQFSRMWEGIKSVDLIAVASNKTVYLIEVKDYRIATDAAPSNLPRIVAEKVFDTLAAQVPCKLNANEASEVSVARGVCQCTSLVIVLHIEQPKKVSGIFRPYDLANLSQKLRQLVSAIDAHPRVVNQDTMSNLGWTVTGSVEPT